MSRKVRLSFAAPLVLIAVVPACTVRTDPQPARPPHEHTATQPVHPVSNPPPPTQPEPPPARPRPVDPTPTQQPPLVDGQPTQQPPQALRTWAVFQNRNDLGCYVQWPGRCPAPPATCNPPPPRKLDSCPTGITPDRTTHIVEQRPNVCTVEFTDKPCPRNAKCAPPRHESITCPQ